MEVPVDVHRDADRGVPELLLHHLDRDVRRDHEAGRDVPQIVEPDRLELRTLERRPEDAPLDVARRIGAKLEREWQEAVEARGAIQREWQRHNLSLEVEGATEKIIDRRTRQAIFDRYRADLGKLQKDGGERWAIEDATARTVAAGQAPA